jgi:hypothetical protein
VTGRAAEIVRESATGLVVAIDQESAIDQGLETGPASVIDPALATVPLAVIVPGTDQGLVIDLELATDQELAVPASATDRELAIDQESGTGLASVIGRAIGTTIGPLCETVRRVVGATAVGSVGMTIFTAGGTAAAGPSMYGRHCG